MEQSECSRKPSKAVKIDERSVKVQEHRKINRIWDRVIKKFSEPGIEIGDEDDEARKAVRFRSASPKVCDRTDGQSGDDEEAARRAGQAALQRKMMKMKSFGKRKSPLQKFDEIVMRELLLAQDEPCSYMNRWPSNVPEVPCGGSAAASRKVTFDTKMSSTTITNVDKEMRHRDKDPSDAENAALMDAVEKLIQAQASCRFDAAVKAAEAATASVPPEMAEEVAIACAKDYQSKIIDFVSQKISRGDGKMPMEVIGYIGITKAKDTSEDD